MDIYVVISVSLYGITSILGSVLVHELGHLLAARTLGIRVSELSVGFGPEVVGFTDRYGVRWKLAPLLVGGACKFPDRAAAVALGPSTARSSLRTLDEASHSDRAIVLAAGPFFNLLLAGFAWLVMSFHKTILPFMSDTEAVLGLPGFLAMTSSAVAVFNLFPIPPLDGGRLAMIVLEKFFVSSRIDDAQLVRIGSWIIALVTIATLFLLIPLVVSHKI